MTPYELQTGKVNAKRKFYALNSVVKRLSGNLYNPLMYLLTNYGHIKQTRMEAKRISKKSKKYF